MSMILFSGHGARYRGIRIEHSTWVAGLLVLGLVLPALTFVAGQQLGRSHAPSMSANNSIGASVPAAEALSQAIIEQQVQEQLDTQLDTIGPRLARLQAQAARLNAITERLLQKSDIDPAEFQLGSGGPAPTDSRRYTTTELKAALQDVGDNFLDQQIRLETLNQVLSARQLNFDTTPSGWPLEKGWISSGYGARSDPVSGKRTAHHGVDFAALRGTPITAVASGIVSFSGRRSGYGLVVEIEHANGYSSRYAHNQTNKVKVGSTVKKGQVIALVGSSGRSTGPHVHFELRRNGKPINPTKFLNAKR